MNFLFLTALKTEADPLIAAYGLQKDSSTHLYSHDHIDLLITGVGAQKTRDRIQSFLEQNPDVSHTVVVNMGIAGGNPQVTTIGQLYRVNAIHDEETGRSFFPDILMRHDQKEMVLTTVSEGITENGEQYSGLVDMEAGPIFQTMASHVPPHRLVFLKVVSDHMNITDWKSLDVTGLIQGNLDEIQSVVNGYQNEALADRQVLSPSDLELLHNGATQLKLTETQRFQLMEWSENFKKCGGSLKTIEPQFATASKSKAERNEIFEKIRQQLSA